MKKLTRKELREAAFLLLFRADFYTEQEMTGQLREFFEDEEILDEDRQFITARVLGVSRKIPEIDEKLTQLSVGWKPKRMAKVDLTVLRLAFYEIMFDPDIPTSVAINEAVELAKNYGEETSGSFVNGILTKVAKLEQAG